MIEFVPTRPVERARPQLESIFAPQLDVDGNIEKACHQAYTRESPGKRNLKQGIAGQAAFRQRRHFYGSTEVVLSSCWVDSFCISVCTLSSVPLLFSVSLFFPRT